MLVISSREFRNNQKKYFDLLDAKVQIVVQRGKDKSYLLMPLSEADVLSVNPALIQRIKDANLALKNGEAVTIANPDNIWESIL